MTESRVASDDDRTIAGMSWWTAAWQWVGALNAFLERVYMQADVDTGC
jgi:hypothetical protein